jgi:hypothetical protein
LTAGLGEGDGVTLGAGDGLGFGVGFGATAAAAFFKRELMTLSRSCGELPSKYLFTAAYFKAALTSACEASGRICVHHKITHWGEL